MTVVGTYHFTVPYSWKYGGLIGQIAPNAHCSYCAQGSSVKLRPGLIGRTAPRAASADLRLGASAELRPGASGRIRFQNIPPVTHWFIWSLIVIGSRRDINVESRWAKINRVPKYLICWLKPPTDTYTFIGIHKNDWPIVTPAGGLLCMYMVRANNIFDCTANQLWPIVTDMLFDRYTQSFFKQPNVEL